MIIMRGLILNQDRYNCIYHSYYSILKLEKTILFIRYLKIHGNEQISSLYLYCLFGSVFIIVFQSIFYTKIY